MASVSVWGTIGYMRESKSQTVRLREEILRALTIFSRNKGGTQQHIVSVGAWFFMCMPANLREALTESFYEWCKKPYGEAGVPKGAPDFARRVVAAIEEECSKEEAKFAMSLEEQQMWNDVMLEGPVTEDEIEAATQDQAAEIALEDAIPNTSKKKAASPSKRRANRGKGRRPKKTE